MPNVRRQTTLSAPASCRSLSLHGGRPTTLTARPAPIGTGLLFRRLDVTDRDNIVPVSPAHVVDVRNCTTLANAADVRVSTVEHLLAAVAAAGIDNLVIDISGPELPAEDGSAEPFMKMIEEAGIVRQAAPRRYVRVLRPVEVEHANGSRARIEPCDRLELDVTIDFDDAAIGRQRVALAPTSTPSATASPPPGHSRASTRSRPCRKPAYPWAGHSTTPFWWTATRC